jgi:ubiquinone/menaquinone biosynthesis C-methylase UbiE
MATFDVPADPAEAYQAYMVPTMFLPWSGELLDRASPQPGDRVLDIACGTGVVARGAAARVGEAGAVTGLDPSPAMLGVARRLGSPEGAAITWVQGTGEALPFDDASFDVVLCQQGMQFFTDRLAAVRQMRRVLVPGGRAAVSVWRGPEHQSVKGAFLLALQEWFGPGALKPYSFPDGDAVRGLFVDAGFHDVTLEIVRRQHFAPSVEELLTMTIMGASAAVPALAQASVEEKEQAIAAVRERIAADIEAVRVEGGISYPMESHIVVASA